MSADGDDPTANSIETPGSGSHIPINFKLKITKEVYDALRTDEKKQVDERHEEEQQKMYRTIPNIKNFEERQAKLLQCHQ